jgi:hypothetical protein
VPSGKSLCVKSSRVPSGTGVNLKVTVEKTLLAGHQDDIPSRDIAVESREFTADLAADFGCSPGKSSVLLGIHQHLVDYMRGNSKRDGLLDGLGHTALLR